MKKLFDLVVWQTKWIAATASDEQIPIRTKVFYGNDSSIICSYGSLKQALRICRELRASIDKDEPTPVDLGNGQTYRPEKFGAGYYGREELVSFGVVINDREFIF